ncbi:MAG: sulfurtransferase [Phototrophicaceae bacterium]
MANLIVSPQWLNEHLQDDNLRIVDIRGRVLPASEPAPHYFSHHEDYMASHIPNAVFVDWTTDIVEPESATYDVANPERYAILMGRLGIGDDTQVIVYDDASGMFAARFWWTLQYYGHENVAVLDGGWQAWQANHYPTSSNVPQVESALFTPRVNTALVAMRADIEAGVQHLLDVRSPAEYVGTTSRARRKGHIPQAMNASRKIFLTEEGTLKSPDELKQIFAERGITDSSDDVVIYCNSGVSASYGLLALRMAGITTGRVYDSSWKEWGNTDDTPIE